MERPSLRLRLLRKWRGFQHSLLFIPTLLTIGAIILFGITSSMDTRLAAFEAEELREIGGTPFAFFLFSGSASAARSLLSSVAGTWATIVGVVFSVTLVTIQLSATKYSAQVIPTFERDRFNQFVLGTFTGTFVYALLVLKTVRIPEENGRDAFIPYLGANVALLLAVVSLFLLLGFIANLTAYMRPTRFVHDLAKKGVASLSVVRAPMGEPGYLPLSEHPEGKQAESKYPGTEDLPIYAAESGYVSAVDWDIIHRVLTRHGLKRNVVLPWEVDVQVAVGDRVDPQDPLFILRGCPAEPDRAFTGSLRAAFELDTVRNVTGDPAYAAETFGDIAVTALSGGSTDVGVAKECLHALLNLAHADLDKPESPEIYRVRGCDSVILRRPSHTVRALCFREMKRILDKAQRGGYWDVMESLTGRVRDLIHKAATGGTSPAWSDTLEWLRPVTLLMFTFEDAQARTRMARNLHDVSVTLDDHDLTREAHQVRLLLLEAARDAGYEGEVLEAMGSH